MHEKCWLCIYVEYFSSFSQFGILHNVLENRYTERFYSTYEIYNDFFLQKKKQKQEGKHFQNFKKKIN